MRRFSKLSSSKSIIVMLLVANLIVYSRLLSHDFVNLDDPDYVTQNPYVLSGWTWEGVVWAFSSRLHGHWHPLTWLSHMTDVEFFGINPAGHHLTNLFLHLANTILIFWLFKKMTGAITRSAFVAALFALHPLHVETVAWVSDRKDVLSCLFWFLAMAAYVFYSQDTKRGRYLLLISAFVLGLMAKAVVVTLPLILLMLDYWPLRRFENEEGPGKHNNKGSGHSTRVCVYRRTARLIAEKLLLLALTAAGALTALLTAQRAETRTLDLLSLLPSGEKICNALMIYTMYIGKMLWPFDLAPFYSIPDASVLNVVGAGLLLSGISGLVFWKGRRYPYLIVGWFWYLTTLLPVIGLVRVVPQAAADRYTYVPLTGLFIVFAWGVPDLLRGWRRGKTAAFGSALLVLGALMICTWSQAGRWKDSVALLSHSLRVNGPHPVIHNNLGSALMGLGRIEEAEHHFSEAVRIRPSHARAHYNMGLAAAGQGRIEDAIKAFTRAIDEYPDYAQAHNNLAVALDMQGNSEEALKYFSEAIRIEPDYAKAHYNRGLVLLKLGKKREAVRHLSEAVRISPGDAKAHKNLGEAFWLAGDKDSAMKQVAILRHLDNRLADELVGFILRFQNN